jgi:phospholipid/cholesterol/gamma-HCH transport system substrate-binding protein
MPRAENWSQLKIGLLALAGIVAAAAAVLFFAQIGELHGDTTRLYMVTDMASGVLDGTEVRLAGQKIGLVRSVALRPPSSDTSERIAITMDVLTQYVRYIRRNSDVQIRPGGQLIGSPVIAISMGTSDAAAIAAGDTLRALAQLESHSSIADAASLGDSITGIAAAFTTVKSEFDTTVGDVAALRRATELQARAVHDALSSFSRRALASKGTIARMVHDTNDFKGRTEHLSALVDSISIAANDGGEIGRFRRDSTLLAQVRATQSSVAALRGSVMRYAGRSGPAGEGAALATQLDLINARLDSIVQDAKRHPLRYIAF